MEKLSTFKQYVLPFLRVNVLMICGWIITVLLFRVSKINISTCLSRQYGLLILFGISAFVYFLWIYCPYFSDLYRNSEKNDNIGLPVASLGMAVCMFMFAKEEYFNAATIYLASTALFMLFLYWDIYKIKQRKLRRKRAYRENMLLPGEVINNKVILVEKLSSSEIEILTKNFCSMYNKDKDRAVVKIRKFTNKAHVLTFPYDIDFDTFCFLMNYIAYSPDMNKRLFVTGWYPVSGNEKEDMFYTPPDEQECDNVYYTTPEGKNYKVDFGNMKPAQIKSEQPYGPVPTLIEDIVGTGIVIR